MGERDGEDSDGEEELDVDLSGFSPLSQEEEEAPTAIDLSIDALQPDELRQLGLDPDATYKMPSTDAGQADLVLPGRKPITNILIIAGGVALFAAAVTIGIVVAPCGSGETTTASNDPTAAGAADASARDATTLAAAPEADDGGTDTAISVDASVDDARAGDAAVDAAVDTQLDAGVAFVIEDPEIPAAVQRMRPRTRSRRARRQRRVALRLHGRMSYERAEEVWRRALVLQPDNRYTHIGLARTLRALDRNDEAAAWQARAEAAAPMRRRRRNRRRRGRMR